jgi:hypothetical protein
MANIQTKNPDLGKFVSYLLWRFLLYFMSVCYILWPFGIFYSHLVYFSCFGTLYKEKSGNPEHKLVKG